ncbi:YicC/YloC family endoribonuclease [Aestuariibius sp. 2305UL40-4]|uniref:YicC/YloC family endoribonuclease n=1 Tax=Aestuariibius violaceus TaxID=3234132 RepID=UPI00345E9111
MIQSMTAYATARGENTRFAWQWDLRGVNARGLDIRLRLPDGAEALDQPVRRRISQTLARGSITAGLRLTRPQTAGDGTPANLAPLFETLSKVSQQATEAGLTLAPPSALDILTARGLPGAETAGLDDKDTAAILADFDAALADFREMRAREGAALHSIAVAQIDDLETRTATARTIARDQAETGTEALRTALDRILGSTDQIDPDRLAQEAALLAIKGDVTEELDRLDAHVTAARTLLNGDGPAGRKLDFLMQEFNREANTLCSKANSIALTQAGLDLKALIEQIREQIQNVE